MEVMDYKDEMEHLDVSDFQDENQLNEALLEVLFASAPLSTTKTLARDPETGKYLSRLSNMGVMSVSSEPDRLSNESALISKQMEDLAFDHFESFTAGYRSVEWASEEMEQLVESADKVEEAIPRLSQACRDFLARVRGISKSRKIHHKTLWQHPQIVELLELSQLMDACVKNQHYDEALELQNHALRLANLHQDIPIIRMIAEEIKESTTAMQRQLHLILAGNVNLPVCLRLVGYLKRLGFYSDFELRIVYLQCRSAFLEEKLSLIPTQHHFNYLTKVIDTTRALLTEITNQYRATFEQDEDSTLNMAPANAATTSTMRPEENTAILQCWLFHQIDAFLKTLETKLPFIQDGTSLANLLSQCMYFGLSLGRLGADFRHLFSPLFENAILQLVHKQLNDALEVFSWQLKRYRPILSLSSPSMQPNSQTSPNSNENPEETVESTTGANGKLNGSSTQTPSKTTPASVSNPPLVLMDFMPLAHFLNLLIGTLNEIRKCCPYSLQSQITTAFENTLIASIERLSVFRSQMEGDSEQDKATFLALCQAFSDHLLPHIFASYDALWKSNKPLIPELRIRKTIASLM